MKRFATCEDAFRSIGLKYSERYVCYNEEIGNRELCPFAANDTCTSSELPGARRMIWERKPLRTTRHCRKYLLNHIVKEC